MVEDALARFAALLARPSDAIPLDEAMLLVASDAHPDLDLDVERGRLDALATGVADPTLEGLVATLSDHLGFTGDSTTYYAASNSLLPDVLDRRQGIPITLSVVAMEVGRRCGVDLIGVGLPGHFLAGTTESPPRYVDLFHGGHQLDDAGARDLFTRVGGGMPWDDAYLHRTDTRHILSRVVLNLAGAHRRAGDRAGLCWALQLRQLLPGAQPEERRELGLLLGASGRFGEGADVLERSSDDRDLDAAARLRARLN